MAISCESDDRLRMLQALNAILDYVQTSAEDIDETALVRAIKDAKSIALFAEKRLKNRSDTPLNTDETSG